MNIQGFNKMTLLDFPGKVACTIFTGGCDLRCPFCHNSSLVLTPNATPVELDEICRNQQVNDGCFARIEDVPTHAMTLTVPTLVRAPFLFCIVPAPTKAKAVYETLNGSIDEHCPASILRLHDNAILYLDNESSQLL